MNLNKEIHFIHANGFPPDAYKPLLNQLNFHFNIKYFMLRSIKNYKYDHKEISNWIPFHNDFIESLTQNDDQIIGLGHSIGGNIILRSCISNPQFFSKIILLDPTLFIPRIIYFWKLTLFLKLHNLVQPWVRATLKRKMNYNNYESMFISYRKKNVFKKISDDNLMIYIKSITKINDDGKVYITYPKEWEYQIYKTGLIADHYIWKNIKYLDTPTLIIRSNSSNAFLSSSANKINRLNKDNIKIITLENSTHLFPLEIPDDIVEIIEDYLK